MSLFSQPAARSAAYLLRLVLWAAVVLLLGLLVLPNVAWAQTITPAVPDDPRSDLELWSLLVGFFLPLVVAFVQQPAWSNGLRATVLVLASLLAGIGTVFFQGQLHLDNLATLIRSTLLVLITAAATYMAIWKQTGIAPKLELWSSGRSAPAGS